MGHTSNALLSSAINRQREVGDIDSVSLATKRKADLRSLGAHYDIIDVNMELRVSKLRMGLTHHIRSTLRVAQSLGLHRQYGYKTR